MRTKTISIFIFFDGITNNNYGNYLIFEWISSGNFIANWSINIDPLSSIMLVVVTFVSALVHIYSIGYKNIIRHLPIQKKVVKNCLKLLKQALKK